MARVRELTFKVTEEKNYGLQETQKIEGDKCPCSVCGHERMEECDESNCQCCSSACT